MIIENKSKNPIDENLWGFTLELITGFEPVTSSLPRNYSFYPIGNNSLSIYRAIANINLYI